MQNYETIAALIDHALLSPNLTVDDLDAGITMAKAYNIASVCIMPYYLKECTDRLADCSVKPSTVIGFPHGGQATSTKRAEAEQAITDGGEELDMVVNISKVLSEDWSYIQQDIAAVTEVAHAAHQRVKVIFENAYLQDVHKIRLCEICTELKADWVKTSTGFASSGATQDDILLMRKHVGEHVQVKAAGGIRDLDTLLAYQQLGVTRCGASATQTILDEARRRLSLTPINLTVTRSKANTSY